MSVTNLQDMLRYCRPETLAEIVSDLDVGQSFIRGEEANKIKEWAQIIREMMNSVLNDPVAVSSYIAAAKMKRVENGPYLFDLN